MTLQSPDIILLDGGVGSEIDRTIGTPNEENGKWWCAVAHISHPDKVEAVHKSFVDAGSQIIVANTYATQHYLLQNAPSLAGGGPSGYSRDDTKKAVSEAIRVAKRAIGQKHGVLVAASISIHESESLGIDPDVALDSFRLTGNAALEAGADAIILEMMREDIYSPLAAKAAAETGLPVYLGISVGSSTGGIVHRWSRHCDKDIPCKPFTEELLHILIESCGPRLQCVGVMHSKPDDAEAAWPLLRRVWSGDTMLYPDLGDFHNYYWNSCEVSDSPEYAQTVLNIATNLGVRFLGGCCGHGPVFIRNLRKAMEQKKLVNF